MAGFEGYSIGFSEDIGAIGATFQVVSVGQVGYSVGFSQVLAGGLFTKTYVGLGGYTIEDKSKSRAIVRFRR